MILDTGTQIGDYRILSRIGKGVYGIVFEAEHVLTRRIDALKVLLDSACPADEEERFLREIQVQASLQHPNIATVYQAFRSPCGLVLAMEFVRGESLRTILTRGRIPLQQGLRYALDTLAGLDYAERAGVIHRDIKPENMLVTRDGSVKLTDFGLAQVANRARITGEGESVGTPMYMSPEQVDGLGDVDARSDVYSMGVVLYELTTGRTPFSAGNGYAVMRAHRETRPRPPSELNSAIGERLNGVMLRALEKDPAKRFANAAGFRKALEQAIVPVRSRRARKVAAVMLAGLAICGVMLATARLTWTNIAASAKAAVSAPFKRATRSKKPGPRAAEKKAEPAGAATPDAAATAATAPAVSDGSEAAAEAGARQPQSPPRVSQPARHAAPRPVHARSTLPRITSAETPQVVTLPEPEKATQPEPAAPVVLPCLPSQAPPAEPTAEGGSKAAPDARGASKSQAPKRRNVVVRALKRVLGG